MEARILTYGAIVTHLFAADREGVLADVVLGYDGLQEYVDDTHYLGAVVGRHANRIAQGHFVLDGVRYPISRNDGAHSLHGGVRGFSKVVWSVEEAVVFRGEPRIKLTYRSGDGEEGYPGALDATVTYTLTSDDALEMKLTAGTDRPTVVNLTQHCYFNLRGHGDILRHVLHIDADRFTVIDDTLIPTGELRPVVGTPFDFRAPAPIGGRLGSRDEQLSFAKGYDHNWAINGKAGELRRLASLFDPATGRLLEVCSTAPGVQFYSGNLLNGEPPGKGGTPYLPRYGLCLEAQHFPDSPNRPEFPSTVLRPGELYSNTILYRFSTR